MVDFPEALHTHCTFKCTVKIDSQYFEDQFDQNCREDDDGGDLDDDDGGDLDEGDGGDLDDDTQAQIVEMVSHIIVFKDKML